MKLLIVYLQACDDLPEVFEALDKINHDILKLKYFPYPDVYRIIHRTIVQHPEYTHIIWLQNDIILNKEDVEKLIKGIESSRVAILGAVMNVDLTPSGLDLLAYTTEPFVHTISRPPPFVKKGKHNGKIRCFHNGGVFICTREFYLDFPIMGHFKTGYNADIAQGRKIWMAGFDYLVDNRIILKHLRYKGTIKVGKLPPEVQFVKH